LILKFLLLQEKTLEKWRRTSRFCEEEFLVENNFTISVLSLPVDET
jgi:hypothetical protein